MSRVRISSPAPSSLLHPGRRAAISTDDHLLQSLASSATALLGGRWTARPIETGSSGRTFALEGDRRLIARFVGDARTVERLSELAIAPRVIASSAVDGHPYVIQERIEGVAADALWMRRNADRVADCIRRYQSDEVLGAYAAPLSAEDYAAEIAASAVQIADGWTSAARTLIDNAPRKGSTSLCATHGDPNATNFIATHTRVWLVDWDDLRRCDPMRDIGQVAWWYLDDEEWPSFVEACGQPAEAIERVHWWAAAESLDVAIRLYAHDPNAAAAFLDDFASAIGRGPNPRRSP